MANVNLGFDGTYTSFSGADAVATFNGKLIGELQAITVNCQREKGPIYVMGNPNPISFSRGKRGIAGNLVFIMFDRDALIEEMESVAKQFGRIPQFTAAGNQAGLAGVVVPTPVNSSNLYTNIPALNSTYNNLSSIVQMNQINQDPTLVGSQGNGTPFVQLHGMQQGEFWAYEDQIPPFDITITMANEYGNAAYMTIYQAEVLNEGMGISIDDINLERACTFVARGMDRLRRGFKTQGIADTSTASSQISKTPTGISGLK